MVNALRTLALVLAGLALGACQTTVSGPPPRDPPPARAATITPKPVGPDSKRLAVYYAQLQRDLLARGLMRTDGGGPDTPFSRRDLVENFIRIAMFKENAAVGGRLVARESVSKLRRWTKPVRIGVRFGDSVPSAARQEDSTTIRKLVQRLNRVSRHPISMVSPGAANFTVLILNEHERRTIGPTLRQIVPGIGDDVISVIQNMPRSDLCLVVGFPGAVDAYAYGSAFAIVRAEHPELMRRSCIHEEMTQGLGLVNDSPRARPSVFNDDEEFALLTTHDELLLRMLYDPRMETGMSIESARPVAETIAAELVGGGS